MSVGFWNTFKNTFAPRLEKAAAIMNGDFGAAKELGGPAIGVAGRLQRAAEIMNGYMGDQVPEQPAEMPTSHHRPDDQDARQTNFENLRNQGFRPVSRHDVIEPMFPTVRDI
jgi:hypothetical protein